MDAGRAHDLIDSILASARAGTNPAPRAMTSTASAVSFGASCRNVEPMIAV